MARMAVGDTYTYLAANGHRMTAHTTHTDRDGAQQWDWWNAFHSDSCHCLTSTEGN